nr:uncharacterized ATP-dependent helicase C29A10.10c-like [Aedes albopictus]
MDYRESTRWYLRRLHQTDFLTVNIEAQTDISRSVRSAIPLDKIHFQHISKRHCIIRSKHGVATLTDETSTTGTYVNNRKFCKEHPGSTILSEGDLIGIGTPCFQDESFYRENNHVLLFQVCRDRNRIVREGDVEVILGSDEEPEDVKVFDLERMAAEEGQKDQAPVPVPRDERLYRIVERIDLSSDEEAVQEMESAERVTRMDERILKETEKKAKELEGPRLHEEIDLTKGHANKENRQLERHVKSESLQKQEEDRNKDRDKHKRNSSDSRDRKKSADKAEANINQNGDCKSEHNGAEKLKDGIDELFQDSYSYPERSGPQKTILSITLDDSDEAEDEQDFSELALTQSYYRQVKKELLEVESQEEEPEPEPVPEVTKIKVENASPQRTPIVFDDAPIYIEDDDEDEDYLEDSKRWFQRLSQRSSPLRTKQSTGVEEVPIIKALPSEKPIELDEYCSRDMDIPDDILDVFKEPDPAEETPESDHDMSGIEELPTVDANDRMDIGVENPDEFLDNFFDEFEDKNEQTPILNPPGSVRSAAPPSVFKPPLPKSPESGRTPMNEKNSNSASNAWISKKVPLIEPHHVVKRRTSASAASLNKKPPKIPKHSPVRKPEVTKEVRKQKLKEITAKKNLANDGDSRHKTSTKPKVKFTPCNRGAFLTEPIPGPSKAANNHQESISGTNNNGEDFICTQSTALTDVPPIDDLIDIAITKAPKLTFNSVAKVSRVAQNAPAFKIPKLRPSPTQKAPSTDSIQSILDNIPLPTAPAKPTPSSKPHVIPILKTPPRKQQVISVAQKSSRLKSILKSPRGKHIQPSKKHVQWSESLVQTRTFELEEGNFMTVQTKFYKDNTDFFRDMSQESCQNEIIKDITSWDADWFDNPSGAAINGNQPLLPMVEEYADFDDYKRIVLPILKTELFHDILGQYVEVKKRTQEPIQMKVNQIRGQGRTFVMNCSVESSKIQSINNKDYVLIMFRDRSTGNHMRFPAVVTGRRQQIQYSEENGLKFFHATIETAKTPLSQRIKDGHGEQYRILALTQINLHMRQFHVLFNLQNSPLLDNILSPKCNFYSSNMEIDRSTYKGKEGLNVQQGDILLSVFGQCLDMHRPHIMLIQGPPGTGKSRVISNLVLQLRRGMPERRPKILVCAQSNTAVDVIVLKLMKLFRLLNKDERCNMLRTGASNKVNPECRIVFLDDLARKHVDEQIRCRKLRDEDPIYETYYLEVENLQKRIKHLRCTSLQGGSLLQTTRLQDELDQLESRLEQIKRLLPENFENIDLYDKERRGMEMHAKKQFVAKADVVCTTLGSCGSLTDYTQSLRFDICIIDEATQCTEIASFTPLQFDVKKLILVGDVKQLPPLVFGKECAEAGLKNSLFSRIQNSFIGTNLEGVKMLTVQYRMHPEILKWPNEYFYDGKLTSDPKATKCDGFPFKPYTIFSLECQQNQTQMEHQIYNNEEIQFVLKLLTEIIQFCDRHTSIAIITPYTRHKRECEKFLQAKKITQVSVLSIDSVQGQEYDVVVISLARVHRNRVFGQPQRLNVALTRARKCLVMCGNFADLREANVWSNLLRDAEQRKVLYHIEEDDEYDDVDTFVEKVMRHLRKNPADHAIA